MESEENVSKIQQLENAVLKLQQKIESMQDEIDLLRNKRIRQMDVIPGSLKNRHFGEPNSFFVSGLAADRPTEGYEVTGGTTYYFASDTGVLSIWDGDAWLSETFT